MAHHRGLALSVACLLTVGRVLPAVQAEEYPGESWARAEAVDAGMDSAKLAEARDYAQTGGGSGFITRHGKLVMDWGETTRRYDLKSTTKSIGVTALGLAIADRLMELDAKATRYHPTLGTPPDANDAKTGWIGQITIRHLATQTAGFQKPGGYTKLLFQPGTKWDYSDGGPNWLAECVTLQYKRDLKDVLFKRVFTPIGIKPSDLTWRENAYRDHAIAGVARREFGSGIHANVDAMARIGLLYLREGKWKDDKQLIPRDFVVMARQPVKGIVGLPELDAKEHGNASDHYGLLWWNNADGTLKDVPRDAYWSWGLYDSLILVIPSLDIVAARAGKSWKRNSDGHYKVLAPFFDPIVASVKDGKREKKEGAKSGIENAARPLIKEIKWAALDTIVRKAEGGDNWPLTWADDGHQYSAYGDGNGFSPKTKQKLSLGFAKISGDPAGFTGVNVRSVSGERTGDGRAGAKASGMLMVDGVLYLWARNTGLSQLAWSTDRGKSWEWSDWKFAEGMAAPAFLNFGRNYDGAIDQFVYVYSFDSPDAYTVSDRMILARVKKNAIRQRDAYEFFVRRDAATDGSAQSKAVWTGDIRMRGAVFSEDANCYRSGVSYNAGLKRFLWAQVKGARQGDTRFTGGLAVYEAVMPWGPWHEVFRANRWDTGPGETASFPTKWMSGDGKIVHLVFSGEDAFSVRKAVLEVRE